MAFAARERTIRTNDSESRRRIKEAAGIHDNPNYFHDASLNGRSEYVQVLKAAICAPTHGFGAEPEQENKSG
jgi:hypothetical protein